MSSDISCLKSIARHAVLDMFAGGTGSSATVAIDTSASSGDTAWKVLIYDAVGRDVLAPLIKIKDLREYGITLHMKIDAPRQSVPEAPATYFVLPTEENVALIATDIVQQRYASYRINFMTQCPRRVLEAFAKGVVAMPSVSNIYVGDRLLKYVALENDLFSLLMKNSFWTMNSRRISDARMEEFVEEVADGICHVISSLQVLPIIATMKTGVSEEVTKKVCSRIQDTLRSMSASTAAQQLSNRPVLLIGDRNSDISEPMVHPFGYGELLVDALGMSLNKVEVHEGGEPSSGGTATKRQIELDDKDVFWQTNAAKDFSVICELVDAEVAKFKQEKSQLKDPVGDDLASLLASAPQLAERKRSMDCHTTLSHALLRRVRERDWDSYHALAEDIAGLRRGSASSVDIDLLKALVGGPEKKGTWHDRLRILCLYTLCVEEIDIGLMDTLEASLLSICPTHKDDILAALKFVKSIRRWQSGGGGRSGESEKSHWGWLDQKLTTAAKTLVSSVKSQLTGGEIHFHGVTRMVDAILTDSAGAKASSKQGNAERQKVLDGLTFTDPKTRQTIDITGYRVTSSIVVMVGGATYPEHYNLQVWQSQKENIKKRVVYGGTEILCGDSLLQQFIELGKE